MKKKWRHGTEGGIVDFPLKLFSINMHHKIYHNFISIVSQVLFRVENIKFIFYLLIFRKKSSSCVYYYLKRLRKSIRTLQSKYKMLKTLILESW